MCPTIASLILPVRLPSFNVVLGTLSDKQAIAAMRLLVLTYLLGAKTLLPLSFL
ncbi:MAG: hypothetical protein ACFKPT_15235 [Gloeotrichia echinulata GP01]